MKIQITVNNQKPLNKLMIRYKANEFSKPTKKKHSFNHSYLSAIRL